jgi:transposase
LIHWESTDRDETRAIVSRLELAENATAAVTCAALRSLPPSGPVRAAVTWVENCPSSDDLRQFACFRKGGSGSSVVEIMRHAVDAANDDLRWSGV